MLKISAVLYLLAAAVPAGTNAVVYNLVGAQRTSVDDLVHEHFEQFRRVVDVSNKDHTLLLPHVISARGLPDVVYDHGQCIAGSALVLYVIELNGSAVLPFVARSSHPALSAEALARVGNLRFRAAQVDGQTVATVAFTNYRFKCPEPGS